MIQDIQQAGTRSVAPLVAATATGIGALAAGQLNVLTQLWVTGRAAGGSADDLVLYGGLAALVLALVAWHLFPRRSWPVLVVAGAVCTLPTPVLLLAPDVFADWMRGPYFVLDGAARPLLLVGLLGAATAVWRAGARRAGAVLIGAAVVASMLALVVIARHLVDPADVIPVLAVVLVVATIVATLVVSAPPPAGPEPRPQWRATAAGALAGAAPLIYVWWPAPQPPATDDGVDAYVRQAGDHLLVLGLAVLGIGLLAGLASGVRVLVAGTAAGVLAGAVSLLTGPATSDLGDVPAAVPALVALLALAAGIACALSRFRSAVGVSGLAVLVVGLLVLYLVFSADDPVLDTDVTNVLTPVLLAITVVAALSVLASLGAVVVSSGAAPVVFAGVAGAVAAGVAGIGSSISLDPPEDIPAALAPYPLVMGLVVAAGLLTVFAHQRWREGEDDMTPNG